MIRIPDSKVNGDIMGSPGSCRPQMGPMLAPWTLLSGIVSSHVSYKIITPRGQYSVLVVIMLIIIIMMKYLNITAIVSIISTILPMVSLYIHHSLYIYIFGHYNTFATVIETYFIAKMSEYGLINKQNSPTASMMIHKQTIPMAMVILTTTTMMKTMIMIMVMIIMIIIMIMIIIIIIIISGILLTRMNRKVVCVLTGKLWLYKQIRWKHGYHSTALYLFTYGW